MIRRLTVFALLLCSGAAAAHKPSDSYLQLSVEQDALHGEWDIALRDLEYAIGLDSNGDGRITWGEVRARQADITEYALRHLHIEADRQRCTLIVPALQIADHTDGAYAALMLDGRCASAPRHLGVDYRALFDIDPTHRGLLRLQFEGTQTAILSPDRPAQTFIPGGDRVWPTILVYSGEGLWHVWKGADHMLFLAGLLLPAVVWRRRGRWHTATRLRDTAWESARVVTAFTLAHALTLSLAAMGVIHLPSRLVESLVAATVVFAGLNNLVPMIHRGLWFLAFFFGLIHGSAIAGALLELGLPAEQRVAALFGFNLGVEAAQLSLIAAVVPASFLVRRSRLYQYGILIPGSIAICIVGLLWLVQRVFVLDLIRFGQ